ncbi:hypothetical protein SynWH8103_02685 [Synechococcus sp. WH 8103]|nr:hypothetical protein SynWH8103_02685 [Synechococcus sp. WH 8103]
MEHVQESVLVSTLKRRSALLTHSQTNGEETNIQLQQVGLSTGTVTVAGLRVDRE